MIHADENGYRIEGELGEVVAEWCSITEKVCLALSTQVGQEKTVELIADCTAQAMGHAFKKEKAENE